MNRRRFNTLFGASLALAALPRLARAENGVSADTIVLGQSCPLTGPAAELGTEMRLGAQQHFAEINQKGGIFGRQIKLVSLDDGYEAARAAANTRKLIEEEKIFALFGYVGTATSEAALPILSNAQVPFVGALTGAQSLRAPFNRNVFNVRAGYFDETEKIVEQATLLGMKKIAVLAQDDAYGQAGLAGMNRALDKRKLGVAAVAMVKRNTVEVAAAVAKLVAARPDVIVIISAYEAAGAFIKQAKNAGYAGQFQNVSFVGSRALSKELGAEGYGVAVSQVVPSPRAGSLAIVREYQQAFKNVKEAPTFISLEGYIAARVLTEGLRRAGKDLTRERLIAGLETMRFVDLGGFAINFTPTDHNGSTFVELTIMARDGKLLY